jgi:osmoprotectant transport system substrate-binding protein
MTLIRTRNSGRCTTGPGAGRRLVASLCAALLSVTGCTSGTHGDSAAVDPRHPPVRVTSFDFPESQILAEIYADALQRSGYPVTRLMGLGSREVVEPALQQGLVDLVPEYAGSALRFLGVVAVAGDSATVSQTRLAAALAVHGVAVPALSPAQDQNGVAVTAGTARARGLRRISDLGPVAHSLTFGGPPECPERPFCLAGLQSLYGLRFQRFLPLPSRDVIAEALDSGEIDVGMLETTDPHLADGKLVALADDRRLQPAENVVPVVRRTLLDAYGPALTRVLDSVSAQLTTTSLAELNRRAVIDGVPVAQVAEDWLKASPMR